MGNLVYVHRMPSAVAVTGMEFISSRNGEEGGGIVGTVPIVYKCSVGPLSTSVRFINNTLDQSLRQ